MELTTSGVKDLKNMIENIRHNTPSLYRVFTSQLANHRVRLAATGLTIRKNCSIVASEYGFNH